MGFKLVRIDTTESTAPAKIPLEVGTHLIGRGSFLDCDDHRVSRQHAVIKVTDNSVVLKSLHQNPCFYNKQDIHKTVVLPKEKWVSLSNTDHFGLLPTSYWYELIFTNDNSNATVNTEQVNGLVKVKTEEQEAIRPLSCYINSETQPYIYKMECDDESDLENLNLEFDETMENCSEGAGSQSLIENYDPVDSNTNTNRDPNSTKKSSEDPNTSSQNDQTKCDDEAYCDSQVTPGKRPHTPDSSFVSKKVKTEPVSPKKAENPKDPTTEDPKKTNTQSKGPIEPHSSQNHGDENRDATESSFDSKKVNTEPESPEKAKNPKDPTTEDSIEPDTQSQDPVEPQSSQNLADENIDVDSDYDRNTDPPSPANELSNDDDVKKEPHSPGVSDVKKEPKSPKVKEDDDKANAGSSSDQPGSSKDGASPAPAPQPPRERCMYGATCYRRNPQHKIQFSHPSDSDYGTGAKGQCPYGAACRRTDPRHWAQHEHPPGVVPGPRPPPLPQGMRMVQRYGQIFYINANAVHFHDDHYEVEDEDGNSVDHDYEF